MKATLHWVSAAHAVDAEVRLYDRLFTVEDPGKAEDYRADLNPASLEVIADAKVEPSAAAAPRRHALPVRAARLLLRRSRRDRRQRPVFNRTVTLKDTWAKIEAKPALSRTSPTRSAVDELRERLYARAVGVRPETRFVEQHGAQPGAARAHARRCGTGRRRGSSSSLRGAAALAARSRRSAGPASRPPRRPNPARDRTGASCRADPGARAACRWRSTRPPACRPRARSASSAGTTSGGTYSQRLLAA